MNIKEINKQTLFNLYEQFPESLTGLSLKGRFLRYQGEEVDIGEFDINELINSNTTFASSISVLSAEDIFKIIRLHALKIKSKPPEKKETNEEKVASLKEENPLMQQVSIVTRVNDGIEEEFFNIVDSTGQDHLFRNDRSVDILAIYEELKYQNPSHHITPDELIAAINRKLYEISLDTARNISDNSQTTEEFANKMDIVNEPYQDDKMHNVYGNEAQDIAVIASSDNTSHQVVTFNNNEFGDLVVNNHTSNVAASNDPVSSSTTDSITTTNEQISHETSSYKISPQEESTPQIKENQEEEKKSNLLTPEQFYNLVNSSEALTEQQRLDVNLYYAYIGDLIIYEDYLLPDLQDMLNGFRAFVYELEYGSQKDAPLNEKQEEAITKHYELEAKKNESLDNETLDKINEDVKKLQYVKDNYTNNQGSISTVIAILLIIVTTVILAITTFTLLS